ncbi:hypothetical protein HAX54_046202, partial [Datura stramonium]|nr:hypothetical protein [Datura stramonium]
PWINYGSCYDCCNWAPSLGSTMGYNVISNNWTPGLGLTMGHNGTTVTGPRALAQLLAIT